MIQVAATEELVQETKRNAERRIRSVGRDTMNLSKICDKHEAGETLWKRG